MSERYLSKRAAGISAVRSDGSVATEENDRQADAAERWAAAALGATYNDAIYADHGDGGSDFTYAGQTVEVVWLGFVAGTSVPRYSGHLIVNPHEPHRHADLYVVVVGSICRGFSLLGCARHSELRAGSDFGYGPRLALPTRELHPFPRLDASRVA
jgi:hypothetical protein